MVTSHINTANITIIMCMYAVTILAQALQWPLSANLQYLLLQSSRPLHSKRQNNLIHPCGLWLFAATAYVIVVGHYI